MFFVIWYITKMTITIRIISYNYSRYIINFFVSYYVDMFHSLYHLDDRFDLITSYYLHILYRQKKNPQTSWVVYNNVDTSTYKVHGCLSFNMYLFFFRVSLYI